ncbi:hypothetical protein HUK80_09505 [Flavobacterium sp. MAH-1]|uniref:Lipoprotein n=1 Tax=Flavobacterium agri TaxID=2743471 RepID=A0A7Y8Y207_9FLAO|nr:hypothetical protein [Flavobacterium agri]NUY81130.1 hypothetical protein [Flavobacterium agri]NYA71154.1 hypothetical protein [Flavobacterium agri]
MKKLLAISAVLAMFACSQHPSEFKGLGGIEIGKDFASIPSSKSFTNTMKNEYFIEGYELGDGIGRISKLNITTNDARQIIEVKFSEDPKTDVEKIEQALTGLKPIGKPIVNMDGFEMKAYMSVDSSVVFTQVISKYSMFKNGLPKREFRYSSQQALKQNAEVIRKSVSARKADR